MFDVIREQGSSVLHFEQHLKTDCKSDRLIDFKVRDKSLSDAEIYLYGCEQNATIAAGQLVKSLDYKAACTFINYANSKTGIIPPSDHFNQHALFASFGIYINNIDGCHIQSENMAITAERTLFVSSNTIVNSLLPCKNLGEPSYGQPRGDNDY